jgi:rhodanese-related sulfurtransferase
MLLGRRFLLLLLLGEAAGWTRVAFRASPVFSTLHRRTAALAASIDPDGEVSDDHASLYVAVDDIDDDDVEDLFFLYDKSGAPKPWAVPPHLRLCLDKVGQGSARLLDVRPADAWRRSSVSLATHCALEQLMPQLRERGLLTPGGEAPFTPRVEAPFTPGWDKETPVYVFAARDDPERVAAAVHALRSAGFKEVLGLTDGFEALRAALPRSRKG